MFAMIVLLVAMAVAVAAFETCMHRSSHREESVESQGEITGG
ncbi:hypothetical protein [Nonomuraea longicatena]